jgi:polyisoprenoid-binding protein YceI
MIPQINFSQTNGVAQNSPDATSNLTRSLKLNKGTSEFIVKGTSSLHDWEMISKNFTSSFALVDSEQENLEIKSIAIKVGVESLESGNGTMDNKCYDALKSKAHPNIQYQFNSIKEIKPVGANTYSAVLNGVLTVAGVAKNVDIAVTIISKDKKLSIKGEKDLKMSDFNVEPPKALLGTIKTGNEITIQFNLNYL